MIAEQAVPRPESILGFRPGTDYKLADYDAMLEYFRAVSEASDRVQVVDIGPSSMGKPMIMAIITSADNFERLDRYRDISRRLALTRGLSEAEARELSREGKTVVYIDSGLHATEVAHAQHSFELLYHLVSDEGPEIQAILDKTILLLLPCVNPDGLDIVVDWYRQNLGTPYEISPLPELYAKYVGHDNNRDWFMFTQAETQNVGRVIYHQWFPQIVYNHHQSAPFPARIFIPPFDDPMNPRIHPLVMRGIQLVGSSMSQRFAEDAKAGVVSGMVFSTWWNGGLRTAPYFHNMVGILTETALYKYATPKFYARDELPKEFRDGTSTTEPSTFYPDPWPGGWWRLRDAIDYMMTASLSLLDVGARYKESWLYNIYQMGRDGIEKGKGEPPYAFVVPAGQSDPSTAVKMVNTLRAGGLEVHLADEPFYADAVQYAAGSYVLLASQPFRPYLLDLLQAQNHPHQELYPGGPPKKPYDIAGWTLPLSMGVRSVELESPFEGELTPIERAEAPPGRVEGSGSVHLLDPRVNDTFIAINRLLEAGATVHRSKTRVMSGSVDLPAGTFVVTRTRNMRKLAEELSLQVRAVSRVRGAGWKLRPLRLALYKSRVRSIDEGWTRWVLEQFEFPYHTLRDAEIRKPGLADRYDVIVIPAQKSLEDLVDGHKEGSIPPEFVGGMGSQGLSNLREFVQAGGTLVCLDSATELPVEYFEIPVDNALADVDENDFYCPGSLLEIELDTEHPIAYGMGKTAAAFFQNGHAWDLIPDFESKQGRVAAKYPDRNPLLSGWILGDHYLHSKAALVDMPYGEGRVILIGFRPQFRGQTHGTFKLLFNSLYYGVSTETSLP